MIFIEIMQKALFLLYKMHMGLLRRPPQEGAQGPRGAPEANQGRKVWKTYSKIDVFKKKHQIP